MDCSDYDYVNEIPKSVTLYYIKVEVFVAKKSKDISGHRSAERTIKEIDRLREIPIANTE